MTPHDPPAKPLSSPVMHNHHPQEDEVTRTYGCDYCPATISPVEHDEGGLCESCRNDPPDPSNPKIHDLFNQLHRRLCDDKHTVIANLVDLLHHEYTDHADNIECPEPYMGYTPGEDDLPERGAIPGERYMA